LTSRVGGTLEEKGTKEQEILVALRRTAMMVDREWAGVVAVVVLLDIPARMERMAEST